jgi:ABC-type lipoprotein release transport system permease subunit
MGLYANGYDTYRIYLDEDIDQQTEEMLVQRIEAIASRTGAHYFRNRLQSYREDMAAKMQLITVFSAISIVFAAVVISMIVSSVTRRIQSDGRRIGMLRAVGADEKTILGCYSGQVTVSFLGGLLLTDAVVAAVLISGMIEGLELYAGYGLAAMLILAVLSWGICRQILRRRIRAIVRKSIIENIREL